MYQTPDGKCITAALPQKAQGAHFGPGVKQYIAHQIGQNRVTQKRVCQDLKDKGLKISEGQIEKIAKEVASSLQPEKDDLLQTGLRRSKDIRTDDTGARHQGKNGFCTVIQNDDFTFFNSTDTKSRISFFETLRGNRTDYLINKNSFEYLDKHLNNKQIRRLIRNYKGVRLETKDALEQFFNELNPISSVTKRVLTESMLYAVLLESGIPKDLIVLSDGAPQFNVFVHAMCWIHAERPLKKLLPKDQDERELIKEVQDHVWHLYALLKAYKERSDEDTKKKILLEFDRIFGKKTSSKQLNKVLKAIHSRKDELLRVLENTSLPLHNNGSERDIREQVTKRKISGGTRSEKGRLARDTYASLVKTCMKHKISFWSYLEDRINNLNVIPYLPDMIKQKSSMSSGP